MTGRQRGRLRPICQRRPSPTASFSLFHRLKRWRINPYLADRVSERLCGRWRSELPIIVRLRPRSGRAVHYRHYVEDLAKKPQAVRDSNSVLF